ncbi:MAG TPA: serpin family protein [Oculatellaceae cyanobacterium]
MNIFKKTLLSLGVLACAVSVGTNANAESSTGGPAQSTPFALGLFKHETKSSTSNVLVSPFSAYVALSMAANGASGTTLDAMMKTLGVSASGLSSLNDRNHAALTSLNQNSKVQMEIANAIFADKNTKFKDTFVSLCNKQYDAEAATEDFGAPQTLTKINNWCDQKTHGKIKKILDKLAPRDVMVILNSVYFKGTWAKPFDKQYTNQQPFFLLSGQSKDVPMMHETMNLGFLEAPGFRAVSVPYSGYKQTMYIFLPDKKTGLAELVENFSVENWQKWMTSFASHRVALSMPRYTIQFSTLLNQPLQEMGMLEAFGPQANFSNLFETKKGYISRVLQKTYMDVNEEGTEAAAVTAVVMTMHATAARLEPPIEFVVDHPFVVALVDEQAKEILFLGTIVEPAS